MLVPHSAPASFDYTYTSGPDKSTTRATIRTSDDAEAHNLRGIAYSENGDQDKAIATFSTAIELKPDFAEAYNNRGIAYGEKGKFDRAIEDLNTAIELKPDFAKVYYNRGVTYEEKGEFDRAIEDYSKAIEIEPNDTDAYNNRGNAYRNKGEFDRAIKDYTKAIALNPDYANAYSNRGASYLSKGDYDRAIEDCNMAIGLKPDFAIAYTNRGTTYSDRGDYDRAIEDYTKAIELNPDFVEAFYNRGNAYSEKGDYNRAIADFTKVIQINPSDADAYYNRGEAWLHIEEWDKAKADLMTAKNMGLDITAAFHNDYESVPDFEGRNEVKLPEDIAAMLTPQVVAETYLNELLGNYARAWEALEKAPQLEGTSVDTGSDAFDPKNIERALREIRAEAEEERQLDPELDAIPETAYEDVDKFLKTIHKFIPFPDIMPLDNGEICLEWRAGSRNGQGQKLFTLSFGGDGHIVFAGIFGAENQARGILTFSMPHLIAIIGMITSLYLHYDY